MTTGRYVLVLAQRIVLVAAVGVLVAVLSVALGRSEGAVYTSSATFAVGPVAIGPDGSIAVVAQTARVTLPSLVRVAASGEVLARAERELGVRAGGLEGAVTASMPDRHQSFLTVQVTGPDGSTALRRADAVVESLQQTAAELTGGGVDVSVVTPPREPRFPSSPSNRSLAVRGGLAGGAVAALAIGLVEAARPRFRSRRDGAPGGPPVLVHHRRTRTAAEAEVDRSTQRLTWVIPALDARRAAEVAGAAGRRAPAVAVVPTGNGDVLVVRSGRASVAEVEARSAGAAAVVLVAGHAHRWADAAADRVRHLLSDRRGDRRQIFAALVPAGVLFVAGLDPALPGGFNASAVAAAALAPVWVRHLPRFRGAVLIMVAGAVSLVSGTVLAMTSGADHGWSRIEATAQVLLVVGALGTIGVVCWARTVMPLWCAPLVFGTGMLVSALPQLGASPNPVKFLLVFPLSLVVLSMCDAWGRRWSAVVGCGALAAVCVTHDGRSSMSFLLATAAILVWQISRRGRHALNRAGTVAAVVGAGVAGYYLVTDLLLSGALGESVAERSRVQVEQSGSLLLGGRPEWSGTLQLMAERSTGFGLGTVPTGADVTAIKQGFQSLRIPTADGYIENYLTAGGFELHSVVADLWVWLGLPGLALGLLFGALVVWGVVDRVSTARAPGVVVYLGMNALWYLAFGPLPSNIPEVSLAIGLCLVPAVAARTRPTSRAPAPAEVDRAVEPVVGR